MLTLIPRASDPAWTRLKAGIFSPSAGGPGGSGVAVVSGGASTLLDASGGVALNQNLSRGTLMIQNNSATGGPTLWYDFGVPAKENFSFSLEPGAGLVICNKECPKEAIYYTSSGTGTLYAKIYENSLPQDQQQAAAQGAEVAKAYGIVQSNPQPAAAAPAAPATPSYRPTTKITV